MFFLVRCLDIQLPCRFAPQKRHHLTLLDGELVTDTVPSTQPGYPEERVVRYLIYDGITICGQSIMELNLLDRLARVYTDVIEPRLQYAKDHESKIEQEKRDRQFLDLYLKVTLIGVYSFPKRCASGFLRNLGLARHIEIFSHFAASFRRDYIYQRFFALHAWNVCGSVEVETASLEHGGR